MNGTPLVDLATDLDAATRHELRSLLDAAFEGEFTDDDWNHALGGTHAFIRIDGRLVAHASVVPRKLWLDDRELEAGYLEAVGVAPELQRLGLGSAAVGALDPALDGYELCALSTDELEFYARLGWERFHGRTWVRTRGGLVRTADEDSGIMVRRTNRTGVFNLAGDLVCEERQGDDW